VAGAAERLPATPVTRPRGRLAFLLPLPVAVVAGLGAGADPQLALAAAAALVSALVLVPRVEWAAFAVIGGAVFEGYLSRLSPWAPEWLYGVLLVAWLLRRAQGRLHSRRLVAVSLPVGLLVAVVGVAFVVHPHGRAGIDVVATYAELAVVMLLLADVLCVPPAPRRAARLYVLSCVAASVCGIVTAIGSDRHRVAGPVASSETLAFFLIAAVPLVGSVRTRGQQPAWWVWGCLLTLVVAGIGTQSRPAFVALVGMLMVAVLTGLLPLRHAGAMIAVVATGVALVIAVLPLPIGQALTDPQRYSDANIAQRNDVRLAAYDMARAGPVIGLGPAAFRLFHQDHLAVDADEDDLDTAYSTVLETSAELGLLGLLALYVTWLLPAALALRRRARSGLTAGVLLALDGLVTASVLESEQYVLPLWFMAAMAFALAAPAPARQPIFAGRADAGSSGQVLPRS
jgi:hypothetical protein